MKLLITNDDGIWAKGIWAIAKELEKEHDVVVVAPDNQRSACGHSITLDRALVVKKVALDGLKSEAYSVDGTPADCVRVGIESVINGKVDMVVSGINNGLNIGIDVLYSGTVSAAIEAAFNNIPSMAISLQGTNKLEDYNVAAEYGKRILDRAINKELIKPGVVLNVNVPLIPEKDIKGIKICKVGNKVYDNIFCSEACNEQEFNVDIQGNLNTYYERCADKYFIKNGYVTITPLQYDLTNYKILNKVSYAFEDMD